MSFTLYKRNMNGEMVPIKMSIWDAFRGAPNPKPRKKDPVSRVLLAPKPSPAFQPESHVASSTNAYQCACCGKFHAMTVKAREQATKDECAGNGEHGGPVKQIEGQHRKDSSSNQANKGGGGSNQTNAFSTSTEETYTDEDDAIIMRMKQQSKSWNEILKAIGKTSKSQVQARYKQLEGKPGLSTTHNGKSSGDNKKDNKQSKAEKDKGEGHEKQAEAKEGQRKKDKEKGTKKKGEKGSNNKTDDSAVKAWADRYDKQKWVAMASKHFDKTGQRITPEQARKLTEEK